MELENINENTIKIKMTFEDLRERGVELSEFLTNQEAVETLFYDVSSELDISDKFVESDLVSFQVRPNAKGIDLMVRGEKVDMENLDLPDDPEEFAKAFEELLKSKNNVEHLNLDTAPNVEEAAKMLFGGGVSETSEEDSDEPVYTYFTASFSDLDDLLHAATSLTREVDASELYRYKGSYYLVVLQGDTGTNNARVRSQVLEFGKDSNYSRERLLEYGDTIFPYEALEKLQEIE